MGRVKLDDLPDVISPADVGNVLGVSYNRALYLVKHGGIIHLKVGNVYLVPKINFIKWLHAGKTRIIRTD
jgi:hypothetical protein